MYTLENRSSNFVTLFCHMFHNQGCSYWGGEGCRGPCPHLNSKPKKVQQFQFETSRILLFTGVQKLYGPEISRFLPCMVQVLVNLCQLFIFSNYIEEIDHFTLDLLKSSTTYRWTFEKFFLLRTSRKKPTTNKALTVRL